jgi:hypothetical protein
VIWHSVLRAESHCFRETIINDVSADRIRLFRYSQRPRNGPVGRIRHIQDERVPKASDKKRSDMNGSGLFCVQACGT